jgi:hypothetical protein
VLQFFSFFFGDAATSVEDTIIIISLQCLCFVFRMSGDMDAIQGRRLPPATSSTAAAEQKQL